MLLYVNNRVRLSLHEVILRMNGVKWHLKTNFYEKGCGSGQRCCLSRKGRAKLWSHDGVCTFLNSNVKGLFCDDSTCSDVPFHGLLPVGFDFRNSTACSNSKAAGV